MDAVAAGGGGEARPAGAGFAASFAATVALILVAMMALSLWRDPFWVLREAPPWTRAGQGASRLLDLEMRRVKPLQMARLRPAIVLVGSSVSYRGLDPRDLAGALPRPAYNAGLSSLMAAELPVMARLLVDLGSVERVVLGLDYFMFTDLPPPPPLRPELATRTGRVSALLGTILNTEAPSHLLSRSAARAEPGLWRADGFKTTPDVDAVLTQRVTVAQNVAAMVYRPARLSGLEQALALLQGHEVALYLSPMSGAQIALLRAGGREPELARWRAEVAVLAGKRGLRFLDLVEAHPFDDFDPGRGSSRFWIDSVHFKPEVGRWVFQQLGLR